MFKLPILKSRRPGYIVVSLALSVLLSSCDKFHHYSDIEHVQRAKEFQDKGNLKSAVIELKNALQKNPKNAEARWLLGDIYAAEGLGKEAEKELTLAGELGVNKESLKASLGIALLQQREFSRVLKEIEPSANSSKANTAKILVIRGQAHIALNNPREGCATIGQAVGFDANYVPAYLAMAQCELLQGRPENASAELDKAAKINPNNSAIWAARGGLETAGKRFENAEKAYTTALSHKADNFDALLGRASARIQLDKLDDAGKDVDVALKLAKDHPAVRHLQGVLLYRLGKYAEAKTAFESGLKVLPDYLPSILWLGLTNFALANYEQANKQLSEFTRRVPAAGDVEALLGLTQVRLGIKKEAEVTLTKLRNVKVDDPRTLAILGQAYLLLGEGAVATKYYEKLVASKPESVDLRMTYANVLWQEGNKSQAIEQLETASRINAPNAAQAETMLILTLIKDKQFDKALSLTSALEKKWPKDANVFSLKGAVLFEKGDLVGARRSFEEAQSLNPNAAAPVLNLAQVDVAEKKPQVARKRLEAFLEKDKANADIMFYIASIAAAEGNEKEFLDWVRRAVKAAPTALRPRQILVAYYLRKNDTKNALATAQEAQPAKEDSPEALDLLGTTQFIAGEKQNALITFKKLVVLTPQSPVAHYALGMAEQAVQNGGAAKTAFNKALELKPDYLEVHSALFTLEVDANRLSEAMKIAQEMQKRYPALPVGNIFEGDVLLLQKQYPAAASAYEKAFRTKESGVLAVKIHRALTLAGNSKEADSKLLSWLKTHPEDVKAREQLAGTYFVTGKNKDAIEQYQVVVKADAKNTNALNNLAVLYAKEGDSRALPTAEEAYKQALQAIQLERSDRALIADTLGWILMQQGNMSRAKDLLKQAVADAPTNPETRYHWAALLAKTGDKTAARAELEQLLKDNKSFEGIEEARKLLGELK